jgi:hypothetical protein
MKVIVGRFSCLCWAGGGWWLVLGVCIDFENKLSFQNFIVGGKVSYLNIIK